MKNKQIRVIVLGDRIIHIYQYLEKVGKTSLITTLISENFPEKIEKVIGPVILPPEMCPQALNISTVLIDTSSDPKYTSQINEEIREADAILLMYDVSDTESVYRLHSYWLPRIKKISVKIPIVIAGNKIDVIENQLYEVHRIHKVITPLIRDFKQVEMGLECSALQCHNISEVIYCAQRAVLYPLAPLYNFSEKNITLKFQRALTRIFRICDKDGDNLLKDQELQEFQLEVFKGELSQNDIKGVKELIKDEINNNSNDVGITQEGFIILQKRCIEIMKIQICWTILRQFGYDDDLQIKDQHFVDELIIQNDSFYSIELSQKALNFISCMFKRFSDKQDLLGFDAIEIIFFTIGEIPWKNIEDIVTCHFNVENQKAIKLENWLNLWIVLTQVDYQKAFKNLVYLGFQSKLHESFVIHNQRFHFYSDLLSVQNKPTLEILLIGHQNSGKTQLLNYLIEKQFSDDQPPSNLIRSIVISRNQKNIILTEVPKIELVQYVSSEKIKKLDFIAIQYDNVDSFQEFLYEYEYILPKNIPKFYIQSKNDIYDGELKNDDVQKQIAIISVKNKDISQFFNVLQAMIEQPSLGLFQDIIEKMKQNDGFIVRNQDKIIKTVILFGIGSLLTFLAFKNKFNLIRKLKNLLNKY